MPTTQDITTIVIIHIARTEGQLVRHTFFHGGHALSVTKCVCVCFVTDKDPVVKMCYQLTFSVTLMLTVINL